MTAMVLPSCHSARVVPGLIDRQSLLNRSPSARMAIALPAAWPAVSNARVSAHVMLAQSITRRDPQNWTARLHVARSPAR
jgi:hypothetical protein